MTGELSPTGVHGAGESFSMPAGFAQVADLDAVSVLFGKSRRPPGINRSNPISDIVTLNLAHDDGTKIDVQGLHEPINITMTIDSGHLCDAEIGLSAGIRCLHWDSAVSFAHT
jgi:hypothetical protein